MASTALASPALARDKSWYVGVEGGPMLVEDVNFDVNSGADTQTLNFDTGYDFGGYVGYDFGMFRLEAEGSYRRASLNSYAAGSTGVPSNGLQPAGTYEANGFMDSLSFMLNGMLDFGSDDGIQGFVGGGVGVARTGMMAETDYRLPNARRLRQRFRLAGARRRSRPADGSYRCRPEVSHVQYAERDVHGRVGSYARGEPAYALAAGDDHLQLRCADASAASASAAPAASAAAASASAAPAASAGSGVRNRVPTSCSSIGISRTSLRKRPRCSTTRFRLMPTAATPRSCWLVTPTVRVRCSTTSVWPDVVTPRFVRTLPRTGSPTAPSRARPSAKRTRAFRLLTAFANFRTAVWKSHTVRVRACNSREIATRIRGRSNPAPFSFAPSEARWVAQPMVRNASATYPGSQPPEYAPWRADNPKDDRPPAVVSPKRKVSR